MSRIAVLACLVVTAVLAAGASAAPAAPAKGGGVLLGVVGPDPAGFDQLTGKHHVLHVIFGAFRADVTQLLARERAAGRIPVLSLASPVAPAQIAGGAEDGWLGALSRQVNASGQAVWVRPAARDERRLEPVVRVRRVGTLLAARRTRPRSSSAPFAAWP